MNLQTTLTAAIRYDQNLTANEKLLYSELTARMDQDRLCSLSNQEVASLTSVGVAVAVGGTVVFLWGVWEILRRRGLALTTMTRP